MSEQGFSEAENSPAVAGPEGPAAEQVGEPDVDWQKRYLDTQAEYSRSQQENAEMRRQQELYDLLVSSEDADTRRQVAEQLGYALDEEQPEFDEENPWSTYDSRLDRIEAALTQRQQDEQDTQQQVAVIRDHVEQRFDALGIDQGDQDWVLAYATNALPATPKACPTSSRPTSCTSSARTNARRRGHGPSVPRTSRLTGKPRPRSRTSMTDSSGGST
jgi:hypothetical protein